MRKKAPYQALMSLWLVVCVIGAVGYMLILSIEERIFGDERETKKA